MSSGYENQFEHNKLRQQSVHSIDQGILKDQLAVKFQLHFWIWSMCMKLTKFLICTTATYSVPTGVLSNYQTSPYGYQ